MGLLANGFRDCSGVFQIYGATASNNAYPSANWANYARTGANRNISAGQGITSDLVGVPMGYLHPDTWILPQNSGATSSHNRTNGSSTASLTLVSGRNISGTSDGASTASATAQLVVSTSGEAAGTSTATASINAALQMSGTSACAASQTAVIGAIAWCSGSSSGSCTAFATSYAIGELSGSISPFTELSPQNLAQYVIEYAEDAPIAANIKKVNDYTVTGDGTSGTEWGPA